MNSLIIQNEPKIKLIFDQVEQNKDGWIEGYWVSVYSESLSASRHVDNPPYGDSPYVLFEQMANNWKGWEGEKKWDSLEGEYSIVATIDNTGHVKLNATLVVHNTWSVIANLNIESGQLETLAKKAKLFFGY